MCPEPQTFKGFLSSATLNDKMYTQGKPDKDVKLPSAEKLTE